MPRQDRAAVLSLVALALLLLRDAVFRGGVFFERDVHLVWYSQVEAFVRSIASGSWPVWDPYTGFGQPLLANPSAQVLYPTTWLHLLVHPWIQYTVYVLLHLTLSGAGVYALGRRLDVSRAGSTLAAALWMAAGPLLSLVNVWHHFGGATWIPWVLLAAETALGSGSRRHALLWGVSMGGQALVGSPDMSVMTAVPLGALVLRHLFARGRADRPARSVARQVLIAVVAALGLSAGQWMPTLAAALGSARFDLNPDKRAAWSVHPAALLQVLFPISFGDLARHADRVSASFDLWSPFLASLYLGLPALGLVAAALASHPRRWRGFLALLGLSAGLFALGRYTPVHGAALAVLPFLKILRYPSKAMVFVALSWALLAGMGHDACRAPGDAPGSGGPSWLASRRARLGVLAPMAVVVALGWAGTLLAFHGAETLGRLLSSVPPAPDTFGLDVRPTAFKLLVSTGLATVVLLFLLGGRTGRWARRCARAAALVAVVDLVAAHWNANATTRKEFFTYRPDILKVFPPGGLTRLHVWDYVMRVPGREPAGPSRLPMFYEVPQGWPPRVGGAMAMQMYLYPPSAARWGLSGSYDPDLLDLGGRTFYDLNLLVRSVEGTPVYTKLLRMGAVDYVVTLHDEGLEGLERMAVIPGLYSEPIRVFRVPDPLPRAYAVGTTRIAEGAAALQALLDESFDPRKELILGSGRPARAGPGFAATCRLIEVKPDRVWVEAELSEPGYVVLVEGLQPGWSATVDGAAAEILPANVAFRAVAVPAGRHQVEYVYRPTAVIAGLLCSGITLLLVVVGLARAGKAGGLV